MDYEWSEAKRAANLAKHGIDLADILSFEWDSAMFFEDDYIDEELRSRMLGYLGDRLVFVVYTIRGDACRVISMRKATRRERARYAHGQ